ncbi:MAG: tetratricopeptide repeat protein [Magnetococcales bacterium]|nr:tetratricopeptide repeat protein [Magnetococcales bacterium]
MHVRPFFLFLLLLVASGAVFWPGLPGSFLLDDNANLGGLSAIRKDPSIYSWVSFLFEGRSGPGGRSLSLLTFAAQYSSWPELPVDFKLVNLGIHLFNGVLLHITLMMLGRLASWPVSFTHPVALMAPALWLLHPMQVSSVFYVVQRMTLLSATFVLLGILTCLKGREWMLAKAEKKKQTRGLVLSGLGITVGGTLAALAKENGALLPVFVLAIETALLAHRPWPKRFRMWRGTLLHGPWIVMCLYLAITWDSLAGHYASRPYTMMERLLTQGRIVTEYLWHILFPRSQGLGLFHDDYPISHGLTQPLSTFGALLFLLALTGIAYYFLRARGWISFGILWFFAGHLLESTILPLELYFEHRNYLPLFGITFLLAAGFNHLHRHAATVRLKGLTLLLGLVIVLPLGFLSRQESLLWGQPFRQALVWAEENPDSMRALLNWGNVLYAVDLIDDAQNLLDRYSRLHPDDPSADLVKLKIRCDHPEKKILVDDAYIRDVTRKQDGNKATITGILEFTLAAFEQKKCPSIDPELYLKILLGFLENPSFGGPITKSSLHLMTGRAYAVLGNLNGAMTHFDHSQEHDLRLDACLQQVRWLLSAGLIDDARAYLAKARTIQSKNFIVNHLRTRELQRYEAAIKMNVSGE